MAIVTEPEGVPRLTRVARPTDSSGLMPPPQAGDHVLWIGEVEYLDQRDTEPLLFYTGRFGTMGGLRDRSP